jgi:hypothetical protein
MAFWIDVHLNDAGKPPLSKSNVDAYYCSIQSGNSFFLQEEKFKRPILENRT